MNSYDEEEVGKLELAAEEMRRKSCGSKCDATPELKNPWISKYAGEGEAMMARGMDTPKRRAFKKKEAVKGIYAKKQEKAKLELNEFADKVSAVQVNKELVDRWKGFTKGMPDLNRTAEISEAVQQSGYDREQRVFKGTAVQPMKDEDIHPAGCECSYCSDEPPCPTQSCEGYQGFWDQKIPEWPAVESYALKQRTEEEELVELQRIRNEDANLPKLGHPKMAEDAELATEKWDAFLKSCLEGYVDTIESSDDYYDDKKPTLKGLLIFYINTGTLTPSHAEAMIGRMNDKFRKMIDRLPEGWEAMWMPVKKGNTRIEKIEF